MKEIYIAGGCFWGMEEYLCRQDGVEKTEVGYANGVVENPSYEKVCTGVTEAAETVHVFYDESKLSLEELVDRVFKVINPTSLNQQGADRGTQYRTGFYFVEPEDEGVIRRKMDEKAPEYEEEIVVELLPLKNFYRAEDYHQRYLKKNPGGYCHIKF